MNCIFTLIIIFLAKSLLAASPNLAKDTQLFNDPFYLVFFLVFIALLPFLAIMLTSFTKIVVVLSLSRQALGTPQVPPNMVIIALAMILTFFSMYPVYEEIEAKMHTIPLNKKKPENYLFSLLDGAKEPIKKFLNEHAKKEDKDLFERLLTRNSKNQQYLKYKDDFIILGPAFLISEISLAFQIGFLIYLPFLIIDLLIANLLMALGMQMLSPTTISLPCKLLLFVLLDGWRLLVEGLIRV